MSPPIDHFNWPEDAGDASHSQNWSDDPVDAASRQLTRDGRASHFRWRA